MKRIPSYRLSEIGDKLCDALGWFAVGICMLLAIAGVTYLVYLNREIKALNVEIAESNRNLAAIREQLSKHPKQPGRCSETNNRNNMVYPFYLNEGTNITK